jgi:hypothetical protein
MSSISTTRRVLAVMAVTTALCADQAAMASPAGRDQGVEIGQLASRLVSRLAQNFRRAMPAVLREPVRQPNPADPSAPVIAPAVPLSVVRAPLSPFQFRLPPPVL